MVRTIADSRSFVGARPVAAISVCWSVFQLSLVTTVLPACNSRTGSANRPGKGAPLLVRDGPIARTITFLGSVPVMMNPPIRTLSLVRTRARVEIFCNCAGAVGGVGVGVGAVQGLLFVTV